jgi:hypothetical protein
MDPLCLFNLKNIILVKQLESFENLKDVYKLNCNLSKFYIIFNLNKIF